MLKNVSAFRFRLGILIWIKIIQNTSDGTISIAHWCYQAQGLVLLVNMVYRIPTLDHHWNRIEIPTKFQ